MLPQMVKVKQDPYFVGWLEMWVTGCHKNGYWSITDKTWANWHNILSYCHLLLSLTLSYSAQHTKNYYIIVSFSEWLTCCVDSVCHVLPRSTAVAPGAATRLGHVVHHMYLPSGFWLVSGDLCIWHRGHTWTPPAQKGPAKERWKKKVACGFLDRHLHTCIKQPKDATCHTCSIMTARFWVSFLAGSFLWRIMIKYCKHMKGTKT